MEFNDFDAMLIAHRAYKRISQLIDVIEERCLFADYYGTEWDERSI